MASSVLNLGGLLPILEPDQGDAPDVRRAGQRLLGQSGGHSLNPRIRAPSVRLPWMAILSGRVCHHSSAPVVRFAAAIDTPVSGDVQTLARLTSPSFPFTPLYAIMGAVICCTRVVLYRCNHVPLYI